MATRDPVDLWMNVIRMRYDLFREPPDFLKLRRRGLRSLQRTRLLTTNEWWEDPDRMMCEPAFREWQKETQLTADTFGIDQWTVQEACLLRGFKAGNGSPEPFGQHPTVTIVTDYDDEVFLDRLSYFASAFDMKVICNRARSISLMPSPPRGTSNNLHLPPMHGAFRLQFEFPFGYPPKGEYEFVKIMGQVRLWLLKCLGYEPPQRLRTSKIPEMSKSLRLATNKLMPREVGDIVEDIFGEDVAKDPKLQNRVKDSRRRGKKMKDDTTNK